MVAPVKEQVAANVREFASQKALRVHEISQSRIWGHVQPPEKQAATSGTTALVSLSVHDWITVPDTWQVALLFTGLVSSQVPGSVHGPGHEPSHMQCAPFALQS
jgi:hypothetical protein